MRGWGWRLWAALIAAVLLGGSWASAQYPTSTAILQNAVSANGNGSTAAATGFPLIGVQATTSGGPPTFTLNFEASIDGSTFVATLCRPIGSTAQVTTATAAGEWRCPVAGARFFRARVSGYAGSGTITVLGVLIAGGSNQVDALQSGEWSLAHITSVTHVAAASPFPVTLAGGVIAHVSSVTHVSAAGVFPVQQGAAGSELWPVRAHQGGGWNVSANQSNPWSVTAHQGANWNIDSIGHVKAAMAHVIGTVSIEGRGSAGTAAGGVLTVQGVAGAVVQPVSANQSNDWAVTAHQGGQWNVQHVSAVTHVSVVSNFSGISPTATACHSRANFVTTANAIIAHGATGLRLYICGIVLQGAGNGTAVSIVEGTAAACGTNTAPVFGSTAANVGFALSYHVIAIMHPVPWISTQTAGNQLCVLTSQAATRVVGVVTYGAY